MVLLGYSVEFVIAVYYINDEKGCVKRECLDY